MSDMPTPTVDRSGSTQAHGAPAASDRNSLSLSPNGPLLLHDVHLVDTLAHFNRENV
ncbi:MAG: catalase, partial [Actinobacteria bacterium]|nr:catalase [Actinomycetota bacterium]